MSLFVYFTGRMCLFGFERHIKYSVRIVVNYWISSEFRAVFMVSPVSRFLDGRKNFVAVKENTPFRLCLRGARPFFDTVFIGVREQILRPHSKITFRFWRKIDVQQLAIGNSDVIDRVVILCCLLWLGSTHEYYYNIQFTLLLRCIGHKTYTKTRNTTKAIYYLFNYIDCVKSSFESDFVVWGNILTIICLMSSVVFAILY